MVHRLMSAAGWRMRRATLAFAMVVLAASANAQREIPGYGQIEDYDPREVAMLPKYCPYTQLFREKVPGGSNAEEREKWHAMLGDTFRALHHYCWGLMKLNRASFLAQTDQARQFYFADAVNEFDFVLRNSQDDFVLLPEILTKKGQVLIKLGKAPIGVMELERAAQLKKDYWPPYAQLSDYYKETGNTQKAREYLEQGLSHAPDAAALKRRLHELEDPKPAKPGAPKKARP
jgi:tetratricopeptide (TPR) repeat protein